MKKALSLLLALVMVFALAACGQEKKDEAPAAPEAYALPPPAAGVRKDGAEPAQEEPAGEPVSLFATLPECFLFSSGAGAWRAA